MGYWEKREESFAKGEKKDEHTQKNEFNTIRSGFPPSPSSSMLVVVSGNQYSLILPSIAKGAGFSLGRDVGGICWIGRNRIRLGCEAVVEPGGDGQVERLRDGGGRGSEQKGKVRERSVPTVSSLEA
jgi:hypothetical protein